jgi:uncharacterized protein YbjT (DUF2867 family)
VVKKVAVPKEPGWEFSAMTSRNTHAVTGAFGYSGKYIAQRLLDAGKPTITLTNSTHRPNPFGEALRAVPFNFDAPDKLRESLQNVSVLYNTYWVRFNHPGFTHAEAVANTETLFQAAKEAGVERIVHISITNPSEDSPLEYFSGKARLEAALKATGVSYAILRPTVLFGKEDILINNIAWMLRYLPILGCFGRGDYKLQPIYVDDLAALCVAQGEKRDNVTIDAIGPETFTYHELVRSIGEIIGKWRPILPMPPEVGYWGTRLLGALVGDVIITRDEIKGLMGNKLYVDAPSPCETKLTDWARRHAETLGKSYTSELARRHDRNSGYKSN